MAAIILQNSTYYVVEENTDYEINPFDFNGNLFSEITINCLTNAQITLPLIASLPNFNCKITISYNPAPVVPVPAELEVAAPMSASGVVVQGKVNPITFENDTIGNGLSILLGSAKDTIVLNPAQSTIWYGVKTTSALPA